MHYPERIVCLTEETTETLYLLGQQDRVVGVSGYTVRPPEARQKPRVSAFISAKFDKIEALRPDLILAFSDLQADIARELIRRGHAVVIFNQRSVAEILQMIRMVGGLVGCSDKAEALATRLAADLDRLRELATEFPARPRVFFEEWEIPSPVREGDRDPQRAATEFPARPRVFFEEWDDPLISGIQWVEELMEIAGGDPIFPELRHAKLARDRIVAPEEVLRREPDVIIASWCGKAVNKDKIASRAGWET